ncbi:MAG: hypothetical protein MMC33_003738 [Icmadophila ericetorum]|nr:hypothetical protein [Icmadophila ericetorum]
MTLVLGASSGALISGQFGLNELASAITELPGWLNTIKFTRRATLYGDRMRRITTANAMDDVEITTAEGLATFTALVFRYVQTPESTADTVVDMLRGKFDVFDQPSWNAGKRSHRILCSVFHQRKPREVHQLGVGVRQELGSECQLFAVAQ